MKSHFLIVLILLIRSLSISAQSEYFVNPSFEIDEIGPIMPEGWDSCNIRSTPDISPSYFSQIPASEGNFYIGLIMLDARDPDGPKNEDVTTELLKPLKQDSTYLLSIDLAFAPDGYVWENLPKKLRISSINSNCSINETLAESDFIDHTEWRKYYFTIKPVVNCEIIKFEIVDDVLEPSYILLDNIQFNKAFISGEKFVCINQQDVVYTLPEISLITNIHWSYSGTGVSLTENLHQVILDFGNNATSGNLIVEYLFNNTKLLTDTFSIVVDSVVPVEILSITGESAVCSNITNVVYLTEQLENISGYVWNYTGIGVTLNAYNYKAICDFHTDATSGNLSVAAYNGCGAGIPAVLPITVDSMPVITNGIIGEHHVCKNDRGVIYTLPPVKYATYYNWMYSGSGVNVESHENQIEIDFIGNITDLSIMVIVSNYCSSVYTPWYLIRVGDIPANASTIAGDSYICLPEENVVYTTEPIKSATEYIWEYSGEGVNITGEGKQIELDFADNATNGFLTVTGTSWCGTGLPSEKLPVTINTKPLPAGTIEGESTVCINYEHVYSVEPIENVTSYIWQFSGVENPIIGNTDSTLIFFTKNFNTGELTVSGFNQCGPGEASPPLTITVNDCGYSIPNTFSPNGDGINDVFVVGGFPELPGLIVFNRLGQKVFESACYQNDWNGIDLNGSLLPSDTYWYVLKIDGLQEDLKGYIYLKR